MTAAEPRLRLTATRVRAGVWEAVLSGAGDTPPAVTVEHDGRTVTGVSLSPLPDAAGSYALRVPIPAEAVADGVQTIVVHAGEGGVLGHVAIVAGAALEADLRAEVELLRAELDLLKRAFRRHCVETAGPG
ncbi:MAG: hypothetical protein ACK4OP_09420 [Gemmobacter sp.]